MSDGFPPQSAAPSSFAPLFDDGHAAGVTRTAPMSLGHQQSHRSNLEELRNAQVPRSNIAHQRTLWHPAADVTSSSPPKPSASAAEPAPNPSASSSHEPPQVTHSAPTRVCTVDVANVEKRMFADQAVAVRKSDGSTVDVFEREYEAVVAASGWRSRAPAAPDAADEFDF